jgi:hypothetical protein
MTEKKPRATHEGTLTLGEAKLDVAVLDNGTRVVSRNAIYRAFGRTKRGRAKNELREPNMPAFIDAKNLQPYIGAALRGGLMKIDYETKGGGEGSSYDAKVIPLICQMYLDARAAGKLLPIQKHLARASEILLVGLSNIGITALVDEATGYQYEREAHELQKILKAYISEELLPWEKRFPDEFYREVFRLRGWPYTVGDIRKKPQVLGKWTKKFIYSPLPRGVLEALLQKTGRTANGNLKTQLHRHLTREQGIDHLNKQMISVVTLLNVSESWGQFERLWNKKFGQQALDFNPALLEPAKKDDEESKGTDFDSAMDLIVNKPWPPKKR